MIADAARHSRVVTIEDGIRSGGIGMSIADEITAVDSSTAVGVLGIPTKFIPHDPKSANVHTKFGLDVDGLVTALRRA
jgi:1-deoxy-D-xylulose-5-phosphate synthase